MRTLNLSKSLFIVFLTVLSILKCLCFPYRTHFNKTLWQNKVVEYHPVRTNFKSSFYPPSPSFHHESSRQNAQMTSFQKPREKIGLFRRFFNRKRKPEFKFKKLRTLPFEEAESSWYSGDIENLNHYNNHNHHHEIHYENYPPPQKNEKNKEYYYPESNYEPNNETSHEKYGHKKKTEKEESDGNENESSSEIESEEMSLKHRSKKPHPNGLTKHKTFLHFAMPILVGLMAWLGTLMMMNTSEKHDSRMSLGMSSTEEMTSEMDDKQRINIHMDLSSVEDKKEKTEEDEEKKAQEEKDKKHEKLLKSLDVTDQVLSIVERGLLLAVRKVELLNVVSGLTTAGAGGGGGGGELQSELENIKNLTNGASSVLKDTLNLLPGYNNSSNDTINPLNSINSIGLLSGLTGRNGHNSTNTTQEHNRNENSFLYNGNMRNRTIGTKIPLNKHIYNEIEKDKYYYNYRSKNMTNSLNSVTNSSGSTTSTTTQSSLNVNSIISTTTLRSVSVSKLANEIKNISVTVTSSSTSRSTIVQPQAENKLKPTEKVPDFAVPSHYNYNIRLKNVPIMKNRHDFHSQGPQNHPKFYKYDIRSQNRKVPNAPKHEVNNYHRPEFKYQSFGSSVRHNNYLRNHQDNNVKYRQNRNKGRVLTRKHFRRGKYEINLWRSF